MNNPRILIAGVGNIFLGDDAFGVEVAQRLLHRSLPAGVRVIDFGIRGYDLAYALMEYYDLVILVDAVSRGGTPGSLYAIEPSFSEEPSQKDFEMGGHSIHPQQVLRLVKAMGGSLGRLLIVGCEPANLAPSEDRSCGLSAPVKGAIEEAIAIVDSLIAATCPPGDRFQETTV